MHSAQHKQTGAFAEPQSRTKNRLKQGHAQHPSFDLLTLVFPRGFPVTVLVILRRATGRWLTV